MRSIGCSRPNEQRTSDVDLREAVEEREPALSRRRESLDGTRVVDVSQALARPVMALELPHAVLVPLACLPVRHVLKLRKGCETRT